MTLDTAGRILRAKIRLGKSHPFFAYLLSFATFREEKNEDRCNTMGTDANANMIYYEPWVGKLNDDEIMGLLAHEIMHCLSPESRVITDKGLREIKDIKEGDKVWSKNGTFTEVEKVGSRHFKGKTYTFRTRFGLPVTFTGEHPILSLENKKNRNQVKRNGGFRKSLFAGVSRQDSKGLAFRFNKAENIKVGDAVCITIPNPNETRTTKKKLFRTRDNDTQKKIYLDEDIAFFLGFFVGDGSLSKQKSSGNWFKKGEKFERMIGLALGLNNDHRRLMQIIENKFHRSPCLMFDKKKKCKRIYFSGKALARFLRRNFYNGSEKTIPTWLIHEKNSIIKSFIDGLAFADGHTSKGTVRITNTANGVYSLLPLLLMKLKIIPSISHYKRKNPNHKTPYSITYLTNRKIQTGIFLGNKLIMPVEKIEVKEYDGLVYNLKTKAHTYCVPYFTTHNCAMATTMRCGTRDKLINNIASDIVINNILISNQLTLPDPKKHGGLVPQNNEMKMPELGITIKEVDKKCTEEIYDIIYQKCPKITVVIGRPANGNGKGSGDGDGEGDGDSKDGKGKGKTLSAFDVVIYDEKDGKGSEGKDGKATELDKALAKEWGKRMVMAQSHSRNRGVVPAGMERLIGDLVNNKVGWKRLLAKHITNEVFTDYSYRRMSKKSHGVGTYMPISVKENVKIAISIDTSGSISQETLTEFLSEIVHIVRSVNNIKASVITCDANVHDELEVRNGDIKKILAMKIRGGGGTSHKPIYKHMLEKKKDVKLLINFTDGYTEFPNEKSFPFETIWVLPKGSADDNTIPFGKVIRVD